MKLKVWEITLFSILGAIMFVSKLIMEILPNMHLIGMFIITFTLVFRVKALIPIYIFVFLEGIFSGFNVWWIPYLYIWTVLWGVTMLLPKSMPKKISVPIYAVVCALHGFLYGTLYAPVQAFVFGLDFKGTVAWIVAGLPFDLVHGVSNFFIGFLIVPVSIAIKRAIKMNN